MAWGQPNLILHTVHPLANTFGKFVVQGDLVPPHCIEIADSSHLLCMHASLSIKTEEISNQNILPIIQVH